MANIEDIEHSAWDERFSFEAHPRVISGGDTGDFEDGGAPDHDSDVGEAEKRIDDGTVTGKP